MPRLPNAQESMCDLPVMHFVLIILDIRFRNTCVLFVRMVCDFYSGRMTDFPFPSSRASEIVFDGYFVSSTRLVWSENKGRGVVVLRSSAMDGQFRCAGVKIFRRTATPTFKDWGSLLCVSLP
jgi:hypothetical protein